MRARILIVAFVFSVVDVVATSVLLAHGDDWDHFIAKLRDRNISTTGFDFMLLALIRAGFLLGCVFGMLRNPSGGTKRVSSILNLVFTVLVLNALYLATKLLIYSETEEFRAGSDETIWFWATFAWTFVALIIHYLLFSRLGTQTSSGPATVPVNADEAVSENTPLLGNNANHEAVSINAGQKEDNITNESSSESDSSSSDESDEEDDSKKKKKKKSFKELVNKVTIRKMLSYSKTDAWMICLAVVFLLGAALAEVFIPLFTGKVISGIAIEQDTAKFTKNIMIMALITIAASVCAGCRGGIMKVVISRFNMRIRNTLFSSLTNQEIGFFDSHKTGDMLSRLTSDTSTMSDMIGLNCNIFLRSLVKAVGTCVFMFSLSWRLSIITFMGLPIVVVVSKLYGNYYKKLQTQVQDAYASANEVAEEVCSSMRTVRSFANENGERQRYSEKMMSVYKVQLKQALAYAGYMWSSEISALALVTGTLWYGGHLVMNDLMNSQNLIAFILYQFTLGDCLTSIGSVYTGLMQALGAAEKVFKLIDRSPLIDLDKGDYTPPVFKGHISFNDVTFSYPSRPDQAVLKNVSFDAPPGQVTALVGPSGGGKSSCVNLLQHFYETGTGSICIDGRSVHEYSHRYLHQKISLVGQEPVLYARSIKENIAYGMEETEYAMADVVGAARRANAHSFITELKEQYETETGEKGTQLSGGQKQRIAIARALIRDPKILLLDEATSALDTESEYLVQQALQETMKDRTVIVIAHRLSTVETADKIVVIDKGEVIEQGTHGDLMKKSGMYYKLVHRQLHGADKHIKEIKKIDAKAKRRRKKSGGGNSNRSLSNSIDIPNENILSRSLSLSSSLNSEKSLNLDQINQSGSDRESNFPTV